MSERKELDRAGIVNRLAAFREIWEIEAGDLIETQVSLGLLFADVVSALGLDNGEKLEVLGSCLMQEFEETPREQFFVSTHKNDNRIKDKNHQK